jgi:hypothetical protein
MISSARAFVRCASGAAAIEFALCIPILLLTANGIADIQRVLKQQAVLDRMIRDTVQSHYTNSPKNPDVTVVNGCNCSSAEVTAGCKQQTDSHITYVVESDVNVALGATSIKVRARACVRTL